MKKHHKKPVAAKASSGETELHRLIKTNAPVAKLEEAIKRSPGDVNAPDPTANNMTPALLVMSTYANSYYIIRELTDPQTLIDKLDLLEKNGAHLNVEGTDKPNPLDLAMITNTPKVAEWIISKGGFTDIIDKLLLLRAVKAARKDCISETCKSFFELGEVPAALLNILLRVNPTKKNVPAKELLDHQYSQECNNTLLHAAVEVGNLKITEQLVKLGANIELKNSDGYTPLQMAEKQGKDQIARYLKTLPGINHKIEKGQYQNDIKKVSPMSENDYLLSVLEGWSFEEETKNTSSLQRLMQGPVNREKLKWELEGYVNQHNQGAIENLANCTQPVEFLFCIIGLQPSPFNNTRMANYILSYAKNHNVELAKLQDQAIRDADIHVLQNLDSLSNKPLFKGYSGLKIQNKKPEVKKQFLKDAILYALKDKKNEQTKIVEFLLKQIDKKLIGEITAEYQSPRHIGVLTLVHHAAWQKDKEMIELLIGPRKTVTDSAPLEAALSHINSLNNPNIDNSWVQVTPLHMAMWDPALYSTDTNIPLVAENAAAIEPRILELAKLFIETYKVDVNTGLKPGYVAARDGTDDRRLKVLSKTPLDYALENGYKQAVRYLHGKGGICSEPTNREKMYEIFPDLKPSHLILAEALEQKKQNQDELVNWLKKVFSDFLSEAHLISHNFSATKLSLEFYDAELASRFKEVLLLTFSSAEFHENQLSLQEKTFSFPTKALFDNLEMRKGTKRRLGEEPLLDSQKYSTITDYLKKLGELFAKRGFVDSTYPFRTRLSQSDYYQFTVNANQPLPLDVKNNFNNAAQRNFLLESPKNSKGSKELYWILLIKKTAVESRYSADLIRQIEGVDLFKPIPLPTLIPLQPRESTVVVQKEREVLFKTEELERRRLEREKKGAKSHEPPVSVSVSSSSFFHHSVNEEMDLEKPGNEVNRAISPEKTTFGSPSKESLILDFEWVQSHLEGEDARCGTEPLTKKEGGLEAIAPPKPSKSKARKERRKAARIPISLSELHQQLDEEAAKKAKEAAGEEAKQIQAALELSLKETPVGEIKTPEQIVARQGLLASISSGSNVRPPQESSSSPSNSL